jgi:hypothetical protein
MAFNARLGCIHCVFRHPSFEPTLRVMNTNHLQEFSDAVSKAWGPLCSELAAGVAGDLARLLHAPATEAWLASLLAELPESRELHRDDRHDFLLLAHTEQAGLYRPPHDHGRGWVVYGVQRGEMEMATYRRIHDQRGDSRLVRRETFTLRAGDVRVFLPGDVHDTRCTAGPLTLFRFTSRDLKREELTRYPEPARA